MSDVARLDRETLTLGNKAVKIYVLSVVVLVVRCLPEASLGLELATSLVGIGDPPFKTEPYYQHHTLNHPPSSLLLVVVGDGVSNIAPCQLRVSGRVLCWITGEIKQKEGTSGRN